MNTKDNTRQNKTPDLKKRTEKLHHQRAGTSTPAPCQTVWSPSPAAVSAGGHTLRLGQRIKDLFEPEREAALKAIQTGVYVAWRCPEFTWDCFRVGDSSLCFCGHQLAEHQTRTGPGVCVPCSVPSCGCVTFAFMPSRPEEVGEPWVRQRPGFDPRGWRARCRCTHPHQQHSPGGGLACRVGGCGCVTFQSKFLCASCDQHWERHKTYFDTEESRRAQGLPYGEAYVPFAEVPVLRNAVETGTLKDSYGHPLWDGSGRLKDSYGHPLSDGSGRLKDSYGPRMSDGSGRLKGSYGPRMSDGSGRQKDSYESDGSGRRLKEKRDNASKSFGNTEKDV